MDGKKKLSFAEGLRLHLRAIKLMNRYCPGLYLSCALKSVAAAVIPYVTVFFSARIIDELAGPRRPEELWKWVALAVAVGGVLAIIGYALNRWCDARSEPIYEKKTLVYSDKQLAMDYADFENKKVRDLYNQIAQTENWRWLGIMKIADIITDSVNGVAGVIGAVALVGGLFVTRVPEGAGALEALDSPFVIAGLAAVLVLLTVISAAISAKAGAMSQTEALTENARFGNRLFGFFGYLGFDKYRALDIRMYRQSEIAGHYVAQDHSWDGFRNLVKGKQGVLYAIAACLPAVLTGAVYVYVCLKAWAGAFGVGMVTQYVSAITALTTSVAMVLKQASEIRLNAPFVGRIFEYLDIPESLYRGSLTTEKRSDRQYDVEFRNVSFKYPDSDRWALRNVSVKFEVGTRLAVVGENGSGKTTFIKLLCRLYDPQEGEILLNGIDIRKYRLKDYLEIFSVVFQDFKLFSQPLGENVAGCRDYDRERVLKSLSDAGFAQRLSQLPDGLDTMLYREFGEEGVELSGGEAQKVAIARALYKDAPFIILDEPTAALDPIAEAEIYAQFGEIAGDRTAIYISHRLSSCKFCDRILVFDDGEIVQSGDHDSLLSEQDGKYCRLWNAQAQYYTEEQ